MCLARLSENPKKLAAYKSRTGWKVFYPDGENRFIFENFSHNGKRVVPLSRWLVSKKHKLIFTGAMHDRYKPRFHIYLRKPKIYRNYPGLLEVKWRGAVATGYQNGIPVVVATKLYVPRVKKARS